MEDAVTFLETAKAVYPDVVLLLNKTQLLALDKEPNEPFGVDTVGDDQRPLELFRSSSYLLIHCIPATIIYSTMREDRLNPTSYWALLD